MALCVKGILRFLKCSVLGAVAALMYTALVAYFAADRSVLARAEMPSRHAQAFLWASGLGALAGALIGALGHRIALGPRVAAIARKTMIAVAVVAGTGLTTSFFFYPPASEAVKELFLVYGMIPAIVAGIVWGTLPARKG